MRAEALTRALGGRWHGRYGSARCPAHDDKRPSLSIAEGDDGRLLCHCHAGCEFASIMAGLGDRGLADQLSQESDCNKLPGGDRSARSIADLINLIWSQSRPIGGTIAERYLRDRFIAVELPPSLRFQSQLRHPTGQHLPAMVGRVAHVRAGVVGLHRTYLDAVSARKSKLQPAKAMLGPCKGGAVRLRQGAHALAVCEGIETALSLASALDERVAVWAALSTSGIVGLALPPRTEFGGALLIGADGDPPGRRAADDLADRASSLGWSVEIAAAPDGQDFNDLAREPEHG